MRLYDNSFPSHLEEIQSWYPVWYREVFEMNAIWEAWGRQLDDVRAGVIRAVDNNLILLADARTISRLEVFLNITHDEPRTLEERRSLILAHFMGRGRIGRKEIIYLLSVISDSEISVCFWNSILEILFTYTHGVGFAPTPNDFERILGSRLPAHLATHLIYSVEYSQSDLTGGAIADLIIEHFYEEVEFATEGGSYHGGAISEHICENYFEEIELLTDGGSYSGVAVMEMIQEFHEED